jgi:hypothetical protein
MGHTKASEDHLSLEAFEIQFVVKERHFNNLILIY